MKNYEYQSDFARKYYSNGLEKGREEGREEGLCRAIVALAGARLPAVPDELAHRLAGLPEARLEKLLIELGTAPDEDAARAVLSKTRARARPRRRVRPGA